ncbi:response regulator transcription factor [Kitasatospora sp. NPDC006786]|uniref:response regulator n=1 Tax=unclassified Kitasatospora TaxID=2633591 RepID=UPI003411797C
MRSNDGRPVGAVAPGIRILIADDQPLVRRGLSLILSPDPSFEVVGEAENGEQAITAARLPRPDVVVMDIRMPRSRPVRRVPATGRPGHRSASLPARPGRRRAGVRSRLAAV